MSLGFSGRLSCLQWEAIAEDVSDVHASIHTHTSKTHTNGFEQNCLKRNVLGLVHVTCAGEMDTVVREREDSSREITATQRPV